MTNSQSSRYLPNNPVFSAILKDIFNHIPSWDQIENNGGPTYETVCNISTGKSQTFDKSFFTKIESALKLSKNTYPSNLLKLKEIYRSSTSPSEPFEYTHEGFAVGQDMVIQEVCYLPRMDVNSSMSPTIERALAVQEMSLIVPVANPIDATETFRARGWKGELRHAFASLINDSSVTFFDFPGITSTMQARAAIEQFYVDHPGDIDKIAATFFRAAIETKYSTPDKEDIYREYYKYFRGDNTEVLHSVALPVPEHRYSHRERLQSFRYREDMTFHNSESRSPMGFDEERITNYQKVFRDISSRKMILDYLQDELSCIPRGTYENITDTFEKHTQQVDDVMEALEKPGTVVFVPQGSLWAHPAFIDIAIGRKYKDTVIRHAALYSLYEGHHALALSDDEDAQRDINVLLRGGKTYFSLSSPSHMVPSLHKKYLVSL